MQNQAKHYLQNWRRWQAPFQTQPQIVKQLEGGLINTNYLVEAGSYRAVLRLNNPDAVKLGVNRQTEITVLKKLQGTNIVPRFYYADSEILVSEYIDGSTLDAEKALKPDISKQIEEAIEIIQSFKITNLEPLNYQAYCQQYCDQLCPDYLDKTIRQKLLQIAQNIDAQNWKPVLCHHDLIPENIILGSQGIVIIDWEYAAVGHPQFDTIRLLNSHHIMDIPANICGLQALQAILVQLWYAIRYPELQATVKDELINVIRTVNAQL